MTDVRGVTADEIVPWVRQIGVGFHVEIASGYPEYVLGTFDLERTLGAFEGDRVVGTLRSFATMLTVPGPRVLRASALTNVSVAPTHRRRGALREMITHDLRASSDRGEPVSILIAAEYPIYGRFGYGPAVETASYAVDARAADFRRPAQGSLELSDGATLRRVGPALYDQFRVTQPGSIERPPHWWDRVTQQVVVPGAEPSKDRVVLYRSSDGELEGFTTYVPKPDWDGMRPQGMLQLQELLSITPAAHHALWSYLCGVDLLTGIEAPLRPTDEVLPLLLRDGRAVKLTARADFVWVRILDVPAALAGRTYAVPGRLVLEVQDPLGFAQGRFALEGGPDDAVCAPSTEPADVTLPVDALGSLYLGGVAARTLELAERLREHHAGAIARLDAMFLTPRAPWCTTWF